MISHIDSTYLCQLTAAQIQEILVLDGVLIQQYQSQLHRWLTIAQLPDLGQLNLNLEPEKAEEIDRRLQQREIVEFTTMTTVMNLNICDRYVFIPLLEQPSAGGKSQSQLWGRICLSGNLNSVWTPQDLSWVQALGQQLLTAMNLLTGARTSNGSLPASSSPLSDLAELIERISELESICQKKDDFINNISHDLRAPLMNIKMAAQMLTSSLRTDSQISNLLLGHRAQKYLSILEQECEREVELINDILDLQRLELSIDGLNLEPVEIATWLPITIEPFIHRANSHHQKLNASASEWIPTIEIDRVCLNKIFTELLNNACKYTHADGEIIVRIDGNASWISIVVKNQAEISVQHLPHIFEQFYRIPGSDRSQQGGTGLGLSLVQKIVRQLNGQIHVTSNSGWTEFTVKLPIGNRLIIDNYHF
ncbi:HAMP domain-containing sensor histidine kinase [Chamaesiphon sp. VAR_48_metabat_135_sub]|uniref:sensor histidine kinase n=1 Tax=Chamaesiphon sp. VAR_48_metabat_135_sub TaxID=2964699 RepID=UPI00286C4A2C|nr:HAMP domain-containing sensor histidine kinase [Chamaesiphon sp. VAR_48_metabat_135_sub]